MASVKGDVFVGKVGSISMEELSLPRAPNLDPKEFALTTGSLLLSLTFSFCVPLLVLL